MAPQVVLDPPEVSSGRTAVDITPWIDQDGIDWGDAEISAYTAEAKRGELAVDYRVPNRKPSCGLMFADTIGGTAPTTARRVIQEKLALMQAEGGWLKRITSTGGTVYADVVGATFHATSVPGWQAAKQIDTNAHMELECIPDFYGDELAGNDHVETTASELIFSEANLSGDYPARVRVAIDDDQGSDQLGLICSFRSRNYDSAVTAAGKYEAEALEIIGSARAVALAGASGGTVVNHGTVSTNWMPVVGTNLGGTAFLTHKGSYRAFARVHSVSGTAVAARLVYDVGDMVNPAANPSVVIPGANSFYIVDLGEIRLDPAPVGTHRWRGQIQAKGQAGTEGISIDEIWFFNTDEAFVKLTAPMPTIAGAINYTYRDEFNQAAGALNAKVLGGPPASFAGPRFAGTGADDTSVGAVAWTSPGNVTASDDTRASVNVGAGQSHYLKATNPGFAIPAGATINGVVVEVERSCGSGVPNTIIDASVRLCKGGVAAGNNKANIASSWPNISDTWVSYGSSSDLWGTTLTVADVNAANFGVLFSVNASGPGPNIAQVDAVRITVYYTPSGGEVWATAGGSATDFSVDANHFVTRTTTADVADAGRDAVAGSTVFTDAAVQCDVKASAINIFAMTSLLLRRSSFAEKLRIDLIGYAGANGATLRVNRRSAVAGNATLQQKTVTASPNVTYTMRAIVTAGGFYYVWLFEQGAEPGDPAIIGQDASLAAGGALASGGSGVYDECSVAVAVTRTYDNFAAWVPTREAVVFSGQSVQLTTQGHYRLDPTGQAYGPAPQPIGDLPRIPIGGLEGRTTEVMVKLTRGDLGLVPDSAIDDVSAKIFYRPCYLFVP